KTVIVGQSRAIARIREQLLGLASLRIPVLFRGEPGVGADHAAQTLATLTLRARTPLVIVRPGIMRPPQKSDSGKVVYLDRIEGLSLSDQGQWFTCIQKCERGEIDAPLRVIASTSSDLHQLAAVGHFDAKLATRLMQFSIEIPPLRERIDDIAPIARHLAAKIACEMGRPRVIVTPPALRALQTQPWPQNVRELRIVIERLVAFSLDGRITRDSVQRVASEAPRPQRAI